MIARRQRSLVALAAAVLVLVVPAGAAAQGQPIEDEYGLPPLDHHAHSGGGGGGGGGGAGSASDAFASSGAAAASPLRVSDVRRGQKSAGRSGATSGRGRNRDERVGIGKPVPPPSATAADPRGGFDVILLIIGGLAAAGLLTFAVLQARRPGRPA
jgi:hypothetical protein